MGVKGTLMRAQTAVRGSLLPSGICPRIIWKTGFVSCELRYLPEIAKQRVEGVPWYHLAA